MGKGWVLPPPVTVYIRGPIQGYIYPYYNYDPSQKRHILNSELLSMQSSKRVSWSRALNPKENVIPEL